MTDEQYKTIGEYTCVEIARNRKFRRQIERLPLGMNILFIIDHPKQFQDEPKKQSRFKRFINRMRDLFNKEVQLYEGAK